MKYHRLELGSVLKCLAVAAGLVAGFPLTPAVAQSLAVVANFSGFDVTEIDTAKLPLSVAATVSTLGYGNNPEWVALTPGGRYAWVANGGANSDNITVIDTHNNVVVGVVPAELLPQLPTCATGGSCRNPGGIAINPCPAVATATPPCATRNGDTSGRIYAYVTNHPTDKAGDTTASVTVIDVYAAVKDPTNATGSTIVSTVLLPIGSQPSQASVSPDGAMVWVSDFTGNLWAIDTGLAVTSPSTAVRSKFIIHPPPFPVVAFTPLTALATEENSILLADASTDLDSIFQGTSFNGNPVGIAILPGNSIWIATDSPDAVLVFNPTNVGLGLSAKILVGRVPFGVAIKPDDGSLALVTNSGDSTVSVINTALQAVVQTIPVDAAPSGIAIQDALTWNPSEGTTPVAGDGAISLNVTGVNPSLVARSTGEFFGNTTAVRTTSTLNTSYAYAAPGTYPARVTVFDKSGATLLTKTTPVVVQSPLEAVRTAIVLTGLLRPSLPSNLRNILLTDLGSAYEALEVGNRSAAFNDISLYINQLSSLIPPPTGTAAALSEAKAIATAIKPPPIVLGTGQLAPRGGTSTVDQPVTFTATWTVPNGKSWRSLQHMDLRLVADNGSGGNSANPLPIALWARFNVGDPSTFQLLDDNENVVASGEPGSAGVLETSTAKLYLADSNFEGSGPTGPSVTVNFAVSFKPAAARGNAAQPYQSQLLASDVLQGVQGPDQLGHWTVRPKRN